MRKYYKLLTILLVFTTLAFIGCINSPQVVYHIGERYSFIDGDVLVTLDETEEKFVFEYTDKDPSASLYFDVSFTYHTVTTLKNSPEFDYTDRDGNILVFDENGHYVCDGDQILYVSYKNASDEIKAAISKGEFNISFGFGPFIVNTHEVP